MRLEFMLPSSLATNTILGLLSLSMDSTIHSFLHLHILFVHAIYQTVDCGGVILDHHSLRNSAPAQPV